MVLVNGMVGIGTGFSTTIPQFNPLDCSNNIQRKLNGLPYMAMKPYYRGFKGKIIKNVEKGITKFITKGKYTIEDDKIIITELPIGKWTHDFKEFIEKIIQLEDSWILDYENHSTDDHVKFIVKVNDEVLFDNTYKKNDVIEDKFKLTSSKSLSNLHLYNKDGVIRKYDTIYQIIDEHYYTRYSMYEKRKDYQINNLKNEIKLHDAKMMFINYVIDDKIVVYKQPKQSIIDTLRSFNFPFYESNSIIEYDENVEVKTEYNYLLNLSVYNFTLEKVQELEKEIQKKNIELNTLTNTDIKEIWKQELITFEEQYKKMYKI
tara:strand:- start:1128 stop:2081 length:954 start_codon:yes stop_codon:yes gene_type:complete